LRDLIRKSPNPRKRLAYFQMKSEEFLNRSPGIKKVAHQITEDQIGTEVAIHATNSKLEGKEEKQQQEIRTEITFKKVSTPIPTFTDSSLIPDYLTRQHIVIVRSRADFDLLKIEEETINGLPPKTGVHEFVSTIKKIYTTHPTAGSVDLGWNSAGTIMS
jgi:hypothetical protein